MSNLVQEAEIGDDEVDQVIEKILEEEDLDLENTNDADHEPDPETEETKKKLKK